MKCGVPLHRRWLEYAEKVSDLCPQDNSVLGSSSRCRGTILWVCRALGTALMMPTAAPSRISDIGNVIEYGLVLPMYGQGRSRSFVSTAITASHLMREMQNSRRIHPRDVPVCYADSTYKCPLNGTPEVSSHTRPGVSRTHLP